MENQKKISIGILIVVILLSLSCNNKLPTKENQVVLAHQTTKIDTIINCSNSPDNYIATDNPLIFKSKRDHFLYLKRERIVKTDAFKTKLSKCEKIPFVFLIDIKSKDQKITCVGEVIDVKTFKKINHQFYEDSLSVYVFQTSPARYPNLVQLPLKKSDTEILCSSYIKDKSSVFWKSIKLEEADPETFRCIELKTNDNEDIILVGDKRHLYFFYEPMDQERFDYLPLVQKDKKRLYNKYYKKK
ncbi:MAG: hypothetical protein CR968_02910 [Flavobacteriia bacterium]|nr:MAG: hypothetical protein CR968_02910 [Flavobacteriia bacterium]